MKKRLPAQTAGGHVRQYLGKVPANQRKVLRAIRAAIRATAPTAVEHFSYGIPGFRLDGRPLIWYAAWRNHTSLYPVNAAVRRALAAEIEGYQTSKGTIRFPLDEPLPVGLVKKIVGVRAREAAKLAKGGRR
jgi:uncharacterized protein YdhG (YjbR/CyaY superfamily)